MPIQIRTVVDHLDGSSEASEWFPEGSAEALEAMQAIIHKQEIAGFAVRREKREVPEAEAAGTE